MVLREQVYETLDFKTKRLKQERTANLAVRAERTTKIESLLAKSISNGFIQIDRKRNDEWLAFEHRTVRFEL